VDEPADICLNGIKIMFYSAKINKEQKMAVNAFKCEASSQKTFH